MKIIHGYAQWTRRQASTAQCSPALAILGLIAAMAITVYIYRQVIMTTIITAVLAAVGIAMFTGAVAVTISTIRWYRQRDKAVTATIVDSRLEPLPATDDSVAAISDEADWLARGGVELAFSPDGKSLVSRDKT